LTLIAVSVLVYLAWRAFGSEDLFEAEGKYSKSWGALYGDFRHSTFFWFIPLYVVVLLRSAVIAFGQNDGLVQVVCFIGLELALFVALSVSRPYNTTMANIHQCSLAGKRVVSNLLLLPFVEQFSVSACSIFSSLFLPHDESNFQINGKRAAGIVLLVIESIVAFVLLLLLVIKLVTNIVNFIKTKRRKPEALTAPGESDQQSSSPKADAGPFAPSPHPSPLPYDTHFPDSDAQFNETQFQPANTTSDQQVQGDDTNQ